MNIVTIILIIVVLLLCVAFYFQIKNAKKQDEEQQQLLKDYERRVNEQELLLKDYRALEKNFNNVGEGYEQALLAFDKLEEERQKIQNVNDKLIKQADNLSKSLSEMTQKMLAQNEKINAIALDIMRETIPLGATDAAMNIKLKAIDLQNLTKPEEAADNEQPLG